jgi:hypothetical protein
MTMKKPKEMPWWMIIILVLMVFTGCKPGANDSKKPDAVIDSNKPKKESNREPPVIDSGQVWFSVTVTKNDTPYIHYEGNWPLVLSSNNSSTIQLAASKKLMSITNMLTIYMHGLPMGKVPVVISGRDTDKVNMVMSQVINGNYDIPILPGEGFLNITKNTGKILSGNFETKAVDANKNYFLLSGTFLNVGINDDKNIK